MDKIVLGLCGPPSAGKTTVAQLLRWKLKDYPCSREVPREYARHYLEKYGAITNIHQQLLIYDGQTKSEKQIGNNYDITISDSPRFLSYIYSKRFFNYEDNHSRAALVRIYELALECLQDYNRIYLLPPATELIKDGIRTQSTQEAEYLFEDIKIFLQTHFNDKTFIIAEHDRNEMEKTVDIIIKDLKILGLIKENANI